MLAGRTDDAATQSHPEETRNFFAASSFRRSSCARLVHGLDAKVFRSLSCSTSRHALLDHLLGESRRRAAHDHACLRLDPCEPPHPHPSYAYPTTNPGTHPVGDTPYANRPPTPARTTIPIDLAPAACRRWHARGDEHARARSATRPRHQPSPTGARRRRRRRGSAAVGHRLGDPIQPTLRCSARHVATSPASGARCASGLPE